jgi:hypothetical protein
MTPLMLLLAAQAPLPAPVEDGLQPPMTYSCRVQGEAGPVEISGRISRFYAKVAPGLGLLIVPVGGAYRDHVVLEVAPTPIPGLAGRYDTEASFPVDTDRMVLSLPGKAGAGGYTLTFSPVRFGTGYQAFSTVVVAPDGGRAAPLAGTCTTVLPNPGKKP